MISLTLRKCYPRAASPAAPSQHLVEHFRNALNRSQEIFMDGAMLCPIVHRLRAPP
jgi:hypothetical protein